MTPAWEQVQREFACRHAEQRLRRKLSSNGAETYVSQCLRCGDAVKVHKKRDVDTRTAEPFDAELRDRWGQQRQARYHDLADAARRQDNEMWWAQYNYYLTTPAWQAKREAVLRRAGGLCQGCGVRRATIAHHLTYDRMGHEMLFDLVAVCSACHDEIHPDRVEEDGPASEREWGHE